ncbi:hypothetical protein ACFQXB_07245 [Plastorhodobacter daqingensis]|uniref:HPt domain-containing protein n=1 Tax=Plastorhodobacter daqingensis TaxID=1387281 RepID=A0ABW2UIY1_9RHOB
MSGFFAAEAPPALTVAVREMHTSATPRRFSCNSAAQAAMAAARLDRTILGALQELMGTGWPNALAQIRCDLETVRVALAAEGALGDRALLRAQSHVLIAVAGTLGGLRVQRLAEELNRAAHTDGMPTIALGRALLQEIGALVDMIAEPERVS